MDSHQFEPRSPPPEGEMIGPIKDLTATLRGYSAIEIGSSF